MHEVLSIRSDLTLSYGDAADGAIGVPALTADGKLIEISYFYGTSRPKNIAVISSQAGCPMRCSFCELGPERFGRNLTAVEMREQAELLFAKAKMHGFDPTTTPHKITVANSGEPFLNPNLVAGLELLAEHPVSFKVSSVFPSAKAAQANFEALADFAARFPRPVQLQISLLATTEEGRTAASGGHVAGFDQIRRAGERWREKNPHGRKVNLSLMVTSAMPIDPDDVVGVFPPELFRFRFREYVPTVSGSASLLRPSSPSRLSAIKAAFSQRGYEVGDWASPSRIERRFGLASNVIRKTYLQMITPA